MQDAVSRKIGFRSWLMLLSAFASIPMIVFSVLSLVFLVESQRDSEKYHLTMEAHALASSVDRHLAARASMLSAVANSDAAVNNDIHALYDYSMRLIADTPEIFAISLIDRGGNILFSTLRAYDESLPDTGDSASALRVIETGRPEVSGVFEGTVSNQRVTSLGVVVRVAGQPRYCLRAIIPVGELEVLLRQQHLPDGWSAAVLDGPTPIAIQSVTFAPKANPPPAKNGDTATAPPRASDWDEGEGLIESALVRVGDWGWRAVVSVPESAFARPLRMILVKFGIVGVLCLLAGMIASSWLASRLGREVSALAAALTNSPPGQETIIREMGEVRSCLLAAKNREEQAQTDSLTGLPGRARFMELAKNLERMSQSDMDLGLAVMFIDLDGFKQVNDHYGHDRGDWVLRGVAAAVLASVRDADVVGRLGGDEFAVCLTARRGHLIGAAESIAARIVAKVGELGHGIGCSIGVSICEICSPDFSRALILADQAMYEAKRLGKNRYVMREDTTP